jgi:hypothetical protein
MSEHEVDNEIVTGAPKILLVKFRNRKYVDYGLNKQCVCHKEFVMEAEAVNSEFC